ncbi:MAG TPA: hypothetical protein VF573_21385 [Paraburkholderia sp.]|uniref:hypothetical protein n=1 Tax=Paraburkholderia sp. TaxID=1926495 RepID=UPI002ED60679
MMTAPLRVFNHRFCDGNSDCHDAGLSTLGAAMSSEHSYKGKRQSINRRKAVSRRFTRKATEEEAGKKFWAA